VDRVHEEFGSIEVLVNNPGVTIDRRFDQMTWEDWNRVSELNLGGTFQCTKALYEDNIDADHGRLINISSVFGQRGNDGQSNDAASKSALFGFTRSVALELAPHVSPANFVAPGYTRTDMVENVREDIQARIREQIPLDRFASPKEIASTVRYITRDDSSYITGEVINVNGEM
jgi:3-oxoacyl-[acyl-carrier protein] reductase